MTDTNVIKLAQPGTFTNSLTEILRNGAHALLAQAVELEVADFIGRHADLKTAAGRQRLVRHGHLPEHEAIHDRHWPMARTSAVLRIIMPSRVTWDIGLPG